MVASETSALAALITEDEISEGTPDPFWPTLPPDTSENLPALVAAVHKVSLKS